jgi:hypothetical protein
VVVHRALNVMTERVPASFPRTVVICMTAVAVALAALLWSIDDVFARLAIAAVGFFALRRAWSATRRRRDLATLGFHTGHRVDNHWVYEELHDGEVFALELPLAYAGRGEFELLVPGEQSWPGRVPAWAGARRTEILERLGTVFKRSDMRVDD